VAQTAASQPIMTTVHRTFSQHPLTSFHSTQRNTYDIRLPFGGVVQSVAFLVSPIQFSIILTQQSPNSTMHSHASPTHSYRSLQNVLDHKISRTISPCDGNTEPGPTSDESGQGYGTDLSSYDYTTDTASVASRKPEFKPTNDRTRNWVLGGPDCPVNDTSVVGSTRSYSRSGSDGGDIVSIEGTCEQ